LIITNLYIWAYRYTPANGCFWVKERATNTDDASKWLKIYREDEPKILFLASLRKPPKN